MMNARKVFTDEELTAMESIGVVLSDAKDYSDDELIGIHQKITDELPCDFDTDGEPLQSGRVFESIIDKFADEFDI